MLRWLKGVEIAEGGVQMQVEVEISLGGGDAGVSEELADLGQGDAGFIMDRTR